VIAQSHLATDCGLESHSLIPSRGKIYFFPTDYEARPPPIFWVPQGLSPGLKQPRREARHSSLFTAETKNGGALTQLPLMPGSA
jgi:hypothetical protein